MNTNAPASTLLRDHHRQAISQLVAQFDATKPSTRIIHNFLAQISRTTDQTLTAQWRASQLPVGTALVAVGGYGRAELFPFSDVDVLILLPQGTDLEQDTATRTTVENFIGSCWDLGLHIGSSVRTIEECLKEAANDITVQTAQLESRLVTGDKTLYQEFRQQFEQQMDVRAFIQGKLGEMRRRHQKYEDTPYALEPNCKESPGGLRDLHVILWITKAAHLGTNWTELAQNGLATAWEERQLYHNEARLKLVRARLHLIAKRHEDRLVFDVQEQLAQALGYESDGERRASEVFMRRYYRTAKAITQLNQILMLSIAERMLREHTRPPRPLDGYFQDQNGTLDIIDDNIYTQDPHQILRTFLVYVQHPGIKTFSARTFRALYNARSLMNASFRKDPINAQIFMAILKSPQGITHAFRLMNQTSVLGRYLWTFRRIVGQMQHDLFHVYTVDQHILMVLRNIRRFFLPEHAHEYPLCSEIAASFDKPWLLYIAALFHDIAKGRGGDHSELGAEEVRRFARAHNIPAEDSRFIEFLVAEHLTMSRIAQKEDLGDPDTIHHFVNIVGDERHLNALYLLTVADIRGTSPKVWNSWKGRLLESLYRISLSVIGGNISDSDALVATRKRAALDILKKSQFIPGNEQKLWSTLGVSYFMRHEPAEIAWHTQLLWDKVESPAPIVDVRLSPHDEGIQVLVYASDQPDLFARICSYFSFTELSIVDARIHTTMSTKGGPGWALDTFQLLPVSDMNEQPIPKEHLSNVISHELHELLLKNAPLPESRPSRRVSRRARYFPLPPLIELVPDESRQRWLLNIIAGDRVGLLYAIARVLAARHINVELAKILTLGDRIEDTFLISGDKLDHPAYQAELEQELAKAIQP